jgi:membrane-associated phospholipid phosphatase
MPRWGTRSAGFSFSGEGYPTSGPEGSMIRSTHHLPITRRRAFLPLTVALAALVACSEQSTAPTTTSTLAPSAASADRGERGATSSAVWTLAWQQRARDNVVSHRLSPIVAVRLYALHSFAQYAAIEAVSGDDDDRGGRARDEAQHGAIAGASVQLLSSLLPDVASALETQLAAEGRDASGRTHPQYTRGVKVGRAAGDMMITRSNTDGYSLIWNESMRNASGVGIWEGTVTPAPGTTNRPSPIGYQFPAMTPYFLQARLGRSAQSQFRPPPPPAYSTDPASPFQIALDEIRTIARSRSTEQTRIANFWNLNLGTVTALGYWDEQAAQFIAESRLDERAASHLYALMNAAVMDATIGCWEAKYHYLLLRPSQADRSITLAQGIPPTLEFPLGFPYGLPNHPSYPSGHSCVSAAAVTVLAQYFPSHAAALGAGLIEAGESRIMGGIHYRFDVAAGQALGRSTAEWAMAYDRRRGVLAAVGLGNRDED